MDHAWFRLAASTIIGISMKTHPNIVDWQLAPQHIVHGVDNVAALLPGCDVGLVCDYHQDEASLVKSSQRRRDIGQNT
jgi:hypothetical protein